MAQEAEGMRGNRSRHEDGQLREKGDDTHMGNIEKEYGGHFRVRSDMQLGTFLEQNGFNSLHELLESNLGRK